MPCDSSHLAPQEFEKEMSKVCCLLEEIIEGKPINKDHFRGFHPFAYNRVISRELADNLTARLCSELKKHPDVKSLSLEMQIWWRDHQAADAAKEGETK